MRKVDFKVAKEFASRIREKLGEVNIIVYGSRARGDEDLFSDMDICVVVNKLDKKTREMIFSTAWETGFKEDIVIVPLIFEKK